MAYKKGTAKTVTAQIVKQNNEDIDEQMYKNINLRIPFDTWKKLKVAAVERSTPGNTVTVTGMINELLEKALSGDNRE